MLALRNTIGRLALLGLILSAASARGADDAAPALAAAPAPLGWHLQLAGTPTVPFKGVVNFDKAGMGSGAMLYPAPSLIGMLAAVATHAVVVNGSRDSKRTAIEVEADKVLLPYGAVLAVYTPAELARAALARTTVGHGVADDAVTTGAVPAGELRVVSVPVFSMTQDQSTLVLENSVRIERPSPAAPYLNTVRVIAHPRSETDFPAYWGAAQGQALRDESARLMALSLDIALHEALGNQAAADKGFKTFRYHEGAVAMVERAQLISETCGRALIKNLRGWLMSIPVPLADGSPACAVTPPTTS